MKSPLRHISIRGPWHDKMRTATAYNRRWHTGFIASEDLPGVGFIRPELNAIKDLQYGTVKMQRQVFCV